MDNSPVLDDKTILNGYVGAEDLGEGVTRVDDDIISWEKFSQMEASYILG